MSRRYQIVGGGGAVFASGGVTSNVIPKSNGASQLVDSALTDNGTTVTSTEVIAVPAGAVGGNSIQLSGTAGTGMYFNSGLVTFSQGGTNELQINGSAAQVASNGFFQFSNNSGNATGSGQTFIRSAAAAKVTLGAADVNGAPVDQTVSVQNAITGSDLPGGHFTIDAPLGTGLGAASKISINRAIMKATGATAQTSSNAFAVGQTKTLSNTSATAQTIATITLGSNAGGGCAGTFTIVATDGTNFDSETQSFNVSFVNKATVVTVGTPAITASTAAVNSGTTSLGITAVANGNNVDIKVTPVFGTIVPTTVTLWPIITHSTGTVTFS